MKRHRVKRKAVRRKEKLTARDKHLLKKFGINDAQYNDTLTQQKGVCYICQLPPKNMKLAQDHRHEKDSKGKQIVGDPSLNRGLLCFRCNKFTVGVIEKMYKKPRDILNRLVLYFELYKMKGD